MLDMVVLEHTSSLPTLSNFFTSRSLHFLNFFKKCFALVKLGRHCSVTTILKLAQLHSKVANAALQLLLIPGAQEETK